MEWDLNVKKKRNDCGLEEEEAAAHCSVPEKHSQSKKKQCTLETREKRGKMNRSSVKWNTRQSQRMNKHPEEFSPHIRRELHSGSLDEHVARHGELLSKPTCRSI